MIVVDASAFLSVLLGEPAGERVLSALQGRTEARPDRRTPDEVHGPLIAPEFLALEVANTIVQIRRRARRVGMEVDSASLAGMSVDTLADAIRSHFEALGITLESFSAPGSFDRVCQLADRFGLSSYDALYVVLAEKRGARLLTLDRAMAAAAVAIGVTTIAGVGSDAN
ncbi:MAG: type II toxin-antitoxin system VapC family toxin [Phycisphaerales bacterium]